MKMRRRPGKHALHILAGQQMHVAQRVDALDLQLAHRLPAHATVRAIGMSLHLPLEPVDWRIALRARALGWAGIFRKIKINVYRLQRSDCTGGNRLFRLNHCG